MKLIDRIKHNDVSVAVLHANNTFRRSLAKVLNCLGFNCIPIESQKRGKIIEEGQKWIRKNISQFREGTLLLHLDPSVDASENHTAQDLIGWLLHKELQIPIVLMKPNYPDSQQDSVLNCPTCNNTLEVVSYPKVELSKLLEAIHKASATKGLPQHNCPGISFFNPKRHNVRLRNFIRQFIHIELKRYIPKIVEAFDKDFCVNLWREFYGKIVENFSQVFNAFHFHHEWILPQETINDLSGYSKTIEQMILNDVPYLSKQLKKHIYEIDNLLVNQICDSLNYNKDSSVLEHYDKNKALHFGKDFDEKGVLSLLKANVIQLQGYFKEIKRDSLMYWQCRFETERLLLTLDVAPAFYFPDEVKNAVREELIPQQINMLKMNFETFTEEMAKLEKTYQLCMKLLEEKDEI